MRGSWEEIYGRQFQNLRDSIFEQYHIIFCKETSQTREASQIFSSVHKLTRPRPIPNSKMASTGVLVSFLYPATQKFDMNYYLTSHVPLVEKQFTPHGLQKWQVVKPEPDNLYVAQCILYFKDQKGYEEAIAGAANIMADVPNYTDVQPVHFAGGLVGGNWVWDQERMVDMMDGRGTWLRLCNEETEEQSMTMAIIHTLCVSVPDNPKHVVYPRPGQPPIQETPSSWLNCTNLCLSCSSVLLYWYFAGSCLEITHQAWRTPGIHPRIVRQMLMRKSAVHPLLRNTAKGGIKIATRYAKTSDELDAVAIVYDCKVMWFRLEDLFSIL